MTVSEFLNNIKQRSDYVTNSLVLKSSDNYGCVYKWLAKTPNIGIRQEFFIELNPEELELELLNKTAVNFIEVYPPI